MPRYFTLAEARAALPVVAPIIREAVQARAHYMEAEKAIHALSQRILMMGGVNVDTSVAEAWKAQYDSNAQSLKNAMERIEDLGILVKDLDTGLIDFPTLFRGEEVYLCWRMDESDIDHWHGVNEGFNGRRPIDKNFVDNHRGEGAA
ncbi:MAG TPA: DUF2203 domain-containing protein [Bryobacteraceae bacterium]|jgi:hypothetical protein|nr:DUF2203 domain-containing protein [Bryobacteraceae bacterium]